MAEGTLRVGNVEIVELTDAHVRFPMPLRQLFPGVTEENWAAYQERYPDAFYGPIPGTLISADSSFARADRPFSWTPGSDQHGAISSTISRRAARRSAVAGSEPGRC